MPRRPKPLPTDPADITEAQLDSVLKPHGFRSLERIGKDILARVLRPLGFTQLQQLHDAIKQAEAIDAENERVARLVRLNPPALAALIEELNDLVVIHRQLRGVLQTACQLLPHGERGPSDPTRLARLAYMRVLDKYHPHKHARDVDRLARRYVDLPWTMYRIAGELLPQAYEDILDGSATTHASTKPGKSDALTFIAAMTELLGPAYAMSTDGVRKAMAAMDWPAIRRDRKRKRASRGS